MNIKTSLFVLMMVLASFGGGAAFAMANITFDGLVFFKEDAQFDKDVNIDGTTTTADITSSSIILADQFNVGTDNATDDDLIRFDGGNEALFWNESEGRFEFSDDLYVPKTVVTEGGIASGGDLFVGTDDALDDDFIRFDSGNSVLMWNETSNRFQFTHAVTSADFDCTDCIDSDEISDGQVMTEDIADGTITSDDIQDGDVIKSIILSDQFDLIITNGVDASITMNSTSNSFCFLVGVFFDDDDQDSLKNVECMINPISGNWVMSGGASSNDDDVGCHARCVIWN